MPTPTTHLGLEKPSTADPFSTGDIANNWQILDNAPGTFICTSTTRPAWGANQNGMHIVETDTGLVWRWDGTQFQRQQGNGWLGGAVNNTQINTTSSSPTIGATVTVSVPTGTNRVLVVANSPWVSGGSSSYGGIVGVQRDGSSIWQQTQAAIYDGGKSNYGQPMTLSIVDLPSAGTHTYRSYLISQYGYSVSMYTPMTIDVFGL